MLRPKPWHLAALLLVACGRIDGEGADSGADGDSPTDGGTDAVDSAEGSSSGSGSSSGAASGQGGTGGDHASGGDHALGGSAPGTSTGGLVSDVPAPWSACHVEYVALEPPCGESDLPGVLSSCGLWFDVPLGWVMTPAVGLEVVLLPQPPGDGAAGVGGLGTAPTQPLALEVFSVFPEEPPWESGETFDLAEPADFVRAGYAGGEAPGYVAKAEGYGIAYVALRQGTETLSVHRGLYVGAPDGPCIK